MRNILISLLVAMISFSFLMADAQAKRFGGGKSFGMSRQASSFSRPTNNSFAQAIPAAKPASTASRWLGPLAGLAAGGLLASLFMGHGLGSGIFSWLLVAGGIFLVWSLIRSRLSRPATQPLQNAMCNAQPASVQTSPSTPFFSSGSSNVKPESVANFDETAFLRNAKALFIRLQTAYDNKNLADIREFTMPEVFAEIQLQIQERGNEPNQTDVVSIDAELLDFSPAATFTLASVQFSGQIREQQGAPLETIKEVWHLHKDNDRSTWLVAGISQA